MKSFDQRKLRCVCCVSFVIVVCFSLCMRYIRDWNTNSKTAGAAQRVCLPFCLLLFCSQGVVSHSGSLFVVAWLHVPQLFTRNHQKSA